MTFQITPKYNVTQNYQSSNLDWDRQLLSPFTAKLRVPTRPDSVLEQILLNILTSEQI